MRSHVDLQKYLGRPAVGVNQLSTISPNAIYRADYVHATRRIVTSIGCDNQPLIAQTLAIQHRIIITKEYVSFRSITRTQQETANSSLRVINAIKLEL